MELPLVEMDLVYRVIKLKVIFFLDIFFRFILKYFNEFYFIDSLSNVYYPKTSPALSTCMLWGLFHFQTFDGLNYVFDGT